MLEAVISLPVSISVSGVGTLSDVTVYKDGAVSGLVPVVAQIGLTTVWNITFTPVATGMYTVFAFGAVQERIKCVTKSVYDSVKNLEDEALGSWSWNKQTGALTLLRQDGSTLATFTAADSLTEASRERVS